MSDIWRLHWSFAPSELSSEYFLGCKFSCLLKYKWANSYENVVVVGTLGVDVQECVGLSYIKVAAID